MKKKLGVLFVLLAAMLLVVPMAAAQLTYNAGFQVQNLSDTDTANITIVYYNKDGTINAEVPDTVPAGSSNTYFPIDASAGFDGSVVISSDQPVAAIANVLATSGTGMSGASYGGFTAGAESVSMPLIMKANSGFSTWFNVQNTGMAATGVTVSYAGQPTCDQNATIEPGAAATFDQSAHGCLPNGYVGAATVTADSGGTIVTAVMQVGPDLLFAYNGFTGGSTGPVIPLVNANNSGFITGIQIQNAGASDTDVTIEYTPVSGLGTACSETKTVEAGSSATFALYAFTLGGDPNPGTDNCAMGATFVGSAAVSQTGGEPLVGIINQLSSDKGSAYNAFDPAGASGVVVMPLIMDRNSGFYTGFNVQNVSATTTTVTCQFTSTDGSVTDSVTSGSLGEGDAFNDIQLNQLADGFVGSAVCTANSAGADIIGVVNQLFNGPGGLFFTYEGFNN
jgi:hypothetical protein